MRVSHTTLELLAAAVWYVGAGVLLWKGAERLLEAASGPGLGWTLTVGLLGAGLGAVQGRALFRNVCVRNLERIRGLESPRAWQFFRPRFFVALAAMIAGAAALALLAGTGPAAALAVAAIDWLIGFSLLVGGAPFWTRPGALRATTAVKEPGSQR